MVSYIVLHIADNCEIYKIPKSSYDQNKSIRQLANKKVLEIMLIYKVENRKPKKLLNANFSRYQIDSELNMINEIDPLYNVQNYLFMNSDDLAQRESIPLPMAHAVPNEKEKQRLYDFLKNKYPVLSEDCPDIIEQCIKYKDKILNDYKKMVKEAYAKKYKNSMK